MSSVSAYTIRFVNQSGAAKSYAVFSQSPAVPSPNTPQVSAAPSKPGQIVDDTTNYDISTLAWFKPLDRRASDVPFVVEVVKPEASPGTIAAPSVFFPSHSKDLGLASSRQTASVIAAFDLAPDQTFDVTPVQKFYLTEGDRPIWTGFEIDFTGKAATTATIIHAADGGFSVTFN